MQIPLKDFFKNPESSAYQLSPNGKYISYLAPYERRMNIHVKNLETNEIIRVTELTDRSVSGYMWATNERLLYVRDFGGDENYHILAVNIDGSDNVDLTPFEKVQAGLIDDLENDEEHVLVSLNTRNPQCFDPYRLNIVTGELTILAENPGYITSWMTDHDGKLRIATATDGVNTSILYRKTETDEFQNVLTTNFRESVSPLFFSFDNQYVYASSNLGRDKSAIVKFDIENGKEIEVLFSHDEVDVGGLSYSKKRQVLTTISYSTWKRQFHFLDETRANLQHRLEQDLGGYEIVIASANKAEDTFLIRTYSDRSLGAYYIYNQNDDRLEKIADVSPWLDENELAEMKPIQYQSRDGLTIHGYLTLPKGVEAKNLPVVVNPHGGPWARDGWGFNPEIQFLANRGYAVLQMNFRGSVGYGRAFWEASFKQWGLAMQDDITDGVNWLIEQGVADKDRISIYGGSYGGYATLAGITLTPDVYACAIDYVGVSNLFTFMNTIPPYWEQFRQMLYEMVGNPDDAEDNARMKATSPVFLIDKIKAPLLIAQGANDPRVAQAESDQMVEALRNNGIDVEYILKTDEGHGFRNEENRFEFYEAMEAFLGKYL
ncbi:MAG: prolyl oligopeptidase family serine peptidase [Saprospiraceae bacterium]